MAWTNTDISISDDVLEGGVCRLDISFSDGESVKSKVFYCRPELVSEALVDKLVAERVAELNAVAAAKAVVAAKSAKVIAAAALVLPVKEVKVDA